MMATLLSKSNSKVLEIKFKGFIAFYNLENGKTVNVEEKYLQYKDIILSNNKFYESFKENLSCPKVMIGINLTNNCNLRCKYCFSDKKKIKKIDIESIKKFIDYITNVKEKAERFFVDMSGSGEPLLYLKEILEIADYCKTVSDKIGKEVTPMLSTNGTLLDSYAVKCLQKHNILFGVSVDGYKELHDLNRVDINGKPTYDIIKKNIQNIEFDDFVGGSMTICNPKTDILKSYLEMLSIFKTVSIRPCRMSYENFDFSYVNEGYEKFVDYLILETLNDNLIPLKRIINGEDFLGKTILKIISNSKLPRRCEAGYAQFALSSERKIFPCSPSIFHPDLEISKAEIEKGINNKYFLKIQNKCKDCIAKNICGCDCFVFMYENPKEEHLCDFKRHLFLLALYYCGTIEMQSFDTYSKIVLIANEILGRSYYDKDLHDLYLKCSKKFTFTQLKDYKDHNPAHYLEIKKKYTKI